MGAKFSRGDKPNGFALPTVLIASVVMLIVLLASVSLTVAVRTALNDQYYNKLAKSAADAGIEYAKACLSSNGGKQSWDTKLTTGIKCDGATKMCLSGEDCNYVYVDGSDKRIRTQFEASCIGSTCAKDSEPSNLIVIGRVELLRSDTSVWRKYEKTARLSPSFRVGDTMTTTNTSTCVLQNDNSVYCWGDNTYGQLGDGNFGGKSALPIKVQMPTFVDGEHVSGLTSSVKSVCALTKINGDPGYAYCWGGDNTYGQLGSGDTKKHGLPVRVGDFLGSSIINKKIKSIAISDGHACAIVVESVGNDQLYCWGDNSSAQLGSGDNIPSTNPVSVSDMSLKPIVFDISVFNDTTCALYKSNMSDASGDGYCWGDGKWGQLGDGMSTYDQKTPKKIILPIGGEELSQISVGHADVCAASNQIVANAYCWGAGFIGDGSNYGTFKVPTPLDYSNIGSSAHIKMFDNFFLSTCMQYDDNGDSLLACFGANDSYRLGLSGVTVLSPTKLSLITGAYKVSVGAQHSCTIKTDSTVYCWGQNEYFQLGSDNASLVTSSPIGVTSLPSFRSSF